MTEDKILNALQRLANAADAHRADQKGAPHPRCGFTQPITVAEGQELNDALDEAWEVLKENGRE